MHKLIIEDDEGKTVAVPLIREEITIGRQEGNTIRLTERNVSRKHARILRRDGQIVVEDLTSYNGTRVNGAPIAGPAPLRDGDQVIIGDYKLGIKEERLNMTMRYGDVALPPSVAQAVKVVPPPQANAPEAAIEGAPTIPVRTLADQGLVPGAVAPAAPPARLVVMSTPLAGGEFVLDRASLVIGRTAENDVVLNHKSISRHHAKIIRDGNRYVVVDLESANGVRVNGTEYERVELQSGDVLELGHVRLRFVSGDEKFTYDPHALRLGGLGGGSRKTLVIAGASALGVAGLVALLFAGGGDKGPKPPQGAVATTKAAAPSQAPGPAPAAPAQTAPAAGAAEPASAAESPALLIAKAREALREEKWPDAVAAADRAATLDPSSAEARELKRAVEIERDSADRFATLKRASDAKDYGAVLTAFGAIPENSMFKDRARPLQQDARAKLVASHLAAAEKQRAAGACDEVRKEVEAVLAVDAENRAANDILERCSRVKAAPKAVAAVAAPRPTKTSSREKSLAPKPEPAVKPIRAAATAPAPSGRSAALTPPAEEAAPAAVDPDELMQQAQDAWVRGQHAAAIDASRRALKVRPGLSRAYQIIAVSSCSLKDADDAKRAYDKVDEKVKPLVKSMCQKSGITLD